MVAGLVMLTPVEDAGPRLTADRLLRIYLQDHHATSSAGVRRARRLADAEAGGSDGVALDRLATEIAAEREVQARVMRALGVRPHRAKEAVAKVAERVGLLKRNGRLVRRSPLTSLVELEAMTIAARGKLAGWEALRAALHSDHVGGIDLEQLIAQSEEHVASFGELHRRRAAEVLSVTTILQQRPLDLGSGSPRPRSGGDHATRLPLVIAGSTTSIVKRTGTMSVSARNVKPMIGDANCNRPRIPSACGSGSDTVGRPRSACWIVYSGSIWTSVGRRVDRGPGAGCRTSSGRRR